MHYSKSYSKKFKLYFSNLIKILIIAIFIVLDIFKHQSVIAATHKIAVIIPLEHKSLKHIAEGIKEVLNKENCSVIVKNAQGDLNLMYSIINHLNNEDVDITNRNSSFSNSNKYHLVTRINDEVSIISFLANLPKLTNIGVIYSNNEKITLEIDELKSYAKKNNLVLHLRVINTLLELPSSVKTISNEAQSFLILKDHLIVSGINVLLQEAEKEEFQL